MRVLPIASGKGGVGKSLLAANLAICLAQAGARVVLADLDLGASNLHLILGQTNARRGIGTYLSSGTRFEDIIVDTDYEGLRFVPGDAEIPGMANVKPAQRKALLKKLLSVDADFLIMDLGAGTGGTIMDFFLCSPEGIVVTAPALTATLNAYVFLKNVLFRLLGSAFRARSPALERLEAMRKDGSSLQRAYLPRIVEELKALDPRGVELYLEEKARFKPRLVMNMIEDPKDAERAHKIRRSCKEYLDLEVEHLGIIYRDDLQDIALSSRLPIVSYKPQSVLSQAIMRIADKVLSMPEDPAAAPLDLDLIDESYLTADAEAEVDYGAKLLYIEELLHSGSLSQGDLIEMVKMQQIELGQLKRENQLLKHKLAKALQEGFQA
jgi:flagellar biosynthesis protein FlhG